LFLLLTQCNLLLLLSFSLSECFRLAIVLVFFLTLA
jgi:hypothetical protein